MFDASYEAANPMRTTLAIDDDVLLAAKGLAERQRKSLGEVIFGTGTPGAAACGCRRGPARRCAAVAASIRCHTRDP